MAEKQLRIGDTIEAKNGIKGTIIGIGTYRMEVTEGNSFYEPGDIAVISSTEIVASEFHKDTYYKKLNERFDKRVEILQSLGYKYYKEFVMFAKSEMSARNHNGIPNGVIMHCEDYHFNNLIGK